MSAPAVLIRPDESLPPTLRQYLRRAALDKFTGKVELNIKDGRIRGFLVQEHKEIPASEI